MMVTYSMACTEILAILKYYLSESELNKIPKEKIEFFERNQDKNYNYEIDKSLPLEKQIISDVANSIIITLYRDYFANERQKKTLNGILILNDIRKEQNKLKNDNSYIIFKEKENINNESKEFISKIEDTSLIQVKEEKWYHKIFNLLRKLIKKRYI